MLTAAVFFLLVAAAPPENEVVARAQLLAAQALAQGSQSRAAAPLIQLHAMLDEVDDLNLLADPFAALVYRQSTDKHVRTLARLFMADLERARGRTVKADDAIDELGFVQDWHAIGSFDNEGKGGCDTDFGPESAVDLQAGYAEKGRELAWHPTSAHSPSGYVDLSLLSKPTTDAVAYALTFLEASADTAVVLSLGVSGGFRLFVNGTKVASNNRYNLPQVDQNRLLVPLRKGLNRILLKVCQEKGPLGFFLRSERAPGSRGTVRVSLQSKVPPLERGRPPKATVLPTLSDELTRESNRRATDAALKADLAMVLAFTGQYPEAEKSPQRLAAQAAESRPDNVILQQVAATLSAEDPNQQRHFLERALRLEPDNVWTLAGLAKLELELDHPERALRIADDLVKKHPRFPEAALLKARAHQGLSERILSSIAIEEAVAKFQKYPRVVREALANSRRWQRSDEVKSRAQVALGLRFRDLDARRILAATWIDEGNIEQAVAQLEKVLTLDSLDIGTHLRLGELLMANGKPEAAEAHFQSALTLSPDEPETHERRAKALLHVRQNDAAATALAQSLKLRPQNPTVRELLKSVRPEGAATNNPAAFPLGPLLEEGKRSNTSDDALVLAEVTYVKVQASGLSSRLTQLVVKPLTQRGVEAFRQTSVAYAPDRQEVRVLKARITKPDGSVVDAFEDGERNVNEPWSGMYFDTRARVLSFPSLAAGDVLEVQLRVEDTSTENLLSDYWGDVDAIQSTVPKLHYRYVVDMPTTRPLYFNKSSLPPWVEYKTSSSLDRTQHRFEASEVSKYVPEANMPGTAEISTPLHLSTYASWDAVGKFYWGLVRDQLVPNEELKTKVAELLKGIDRKNTGLVVAALYGFVVKNTRYVALEFGIHGYKPYRVDRVLARRFGDCKDKASLLWAMLQVAKVDARLVLLRMRHLGLLSPEPASLSAFNHAIVYVPGLDVYLDGTAEYHGSKELPVSDRRANALIVDGEGHSQFVITPEARPDDNGTDLTMSVTLKDDGRASASGSVVSRGQDAPPSRQAFETAGSRRSTFEQQWAQAFPGLSVSALKVSDAAALEAPSQLEFSIEIPRYAEATAGRLRLFPVGASRIYTQAMAPLPKRGFAAQFGQVFHNRYQVTYTPPPGFQAAAVPERTVETSPFGTLTLDYQREGLGLVVKGELTLSQARIEVEQYPVFRAWLIRVDAAFSRKLVFEQQTEPSAAWRAQPGTP